MTRVSIWKDERWPDYGLDTAPSKHDRTVEIDDALLAKIRAAEQAYSEAQSALAKLYEEQS